MSQVTTTICQVTNTSKADAIYQISCDWQGGIGAGALSHYPVKIASNETATFQHVGNQNGSQAAVVYRVTNTAGKTYDVVLAWFNQPNSVNKAYTAVVEAGAITTDYWAAIFDKLYKSSNKVTDSLCGITSAVDIGDGNFPIFLATISVCSISCNCESNNRLSKLKNK